MKPAAPTATDAPQRAGDAPPAPRLPHERDQSRGEVAPEPNPVIEQAARDLKAGQVDTDLRGTPGADAPQRRRIAGTDVRPDAVDDKGRSSR